MTHATTRDLNPKRNVLYRFLLLCLLFFSYFGYLSYEYNLLTGGITAALTWSFFVLCTPVADAGFLLDFPLRLLFGIRMFFSEIAVWGIAIALNMVSLVYFAEYYETTKITKLLHAILTNLYPYWILILLSGLGTFLSIRFGDELMDVIHHRDRAYFHKHGLKHEMLIVIFFIVVFFGYYEVASTLGVELQ